MVCDRPARPARSRARRKAFDRMLELPGAASRRAPSGRRISCLFPPCGGELDESSQAHRADASEAQAAATGRGAGMAVIRASGVCDADGRAACRGRADRGRRQLSRSATRRLPRPRFCPGRGKRQCRRHFRAPDSRGAAAASPQLERGRAGRWTDRCRRLCACTLRQAIAPRRSRDCVPGARWSWPNRSTDRRLELSAPIRCRVGRGRCCVGDPCIRAAARAARPPDHGDGIATRRFLPHRFGLRRRYLGQRQCARRPQDRPRVRADYGRRLADADGRRRLLRHGGP